MHDSDLRGTDRANAPVPWSVRHGAFLCFVLALFLRLPGVGSTELSIDETWTWFVTDRVLTTGEFWSSVVLGVDGPLFVAVNVVFASVFGLSAAALRLPQVLFGTLSVLVAVSLFRRRSPSLASIVGLLVAGSPFLVFYSKDARPYAQLLFFALVFVHIFERNRGGRGFRRRLALGTATILAITSHYYALVFFAAFYSVLLTAHALERRRDALRADLGTGVVTLALSAPFLLPLVVGAGSISSPYWQIASIGVPGVVTEQFLFLGTTLPGGDELLGLELLFTAFLLFPFLHVVARRTPLEDPDPLLSLWWAAPLMVAILGALIGSDLLFYPRGFIPTTPFLFAYWVTFTRAMEVSRWRRRAYVAGMLAPFVLSGLLVAASHPAHPYFRGRDVLIDIARDAGRNSQSYDVVLVHHWWMTQFYYYALPEPEKVQLLGRDAPLSEELESLPREARVLLVVNDIPEEVTGTELDVAGALASERPLLDERPCLYPALEGAGLVCRRILLFGPAGE